MTQHETVSSHAARTSHAPATRLTTAPVSLPWQPLDQIAGEWAALVHCAQSASAYAAAGRAMLALSWEESARVQYAAAIGMREQHAYAALVPQLEQVLRDLTEAWREWRATASWMLTGQLIRLRPAGEIPCSDLLQNSDAFASETERIHAFRQAALAQQERIARLFAGVEDEYVTLCLEQHILLDYAFLPLIVPPPKTLPSLQKQQHEQPQLKEARP